MTLEVLFMYHIPLYTLSYGLFIDLQYVKITWSPFHSQLTLLQNAINKWHTLRDIFSDPHAETLSQTSVSCTFVPYVIIAKYVPFQRHFYDNKKRIFFL